MSVEAGSPPSSNSRKISHHRNAEVADLPVCVAPVFRYMASTVSLRERTPSVLIGKLPVSGRPSTKPVAAGVSEVGAGAAAPAAATGANSGIRHFKKRSTKSRFATNAGGSSSAMASALNARVSAANPESS
ncbi:hypothetical protein CVT25_008000 [Psilocybe cyanescens]|uniref:Uncharacterized protein n=1 Tax=Psilocybe cyanescens TaxID=93625 RepID=A0A409VZC3_PSICY|nr:hypothetical protein CVT25_008000 [Psilocybe cyanescens]